MALAVDAGEPPGFGDCGGGGKPLCPYYQSGSPSVCGPCASERITAPPPNACSTCSQPLGAGSTGCRNGLCHDGGRHWTQVYAIGLKKDVLERVLIRYKRHHGWAPVLARILVWWLDDRWPFDPSQADVITCVPHAPGEHDRGYSPGHLVLRMAADEDPLLPIDRGQPQPVITKHHETDSMTTMTIGERRQASRGDYYDALHVPDPSRVAGKHVLVVDDFMTSGSTLNAVARRLREAGATQVDGLVFARATW